MDTRLILATGRDYPIPECQLAIHQPLIDEIALIGESNFFTAIQTLTINKDLFDLDKSLLTNVSNFQIFMTIMGQKETLDKKQAVQELFTLILPQYSVIFTPQSLLVRKEETIVIDDSNFLPLQDAIKDIFCLRSDLGGNKSFNPANAEAKRIAEKLMRGRQKIAAEKNEGNGSVFGQYISILSIALHISQRELQKYTVFQLYDSVERLGLYTEYDLDIRTRLAGGKPDKAPENWMKNIH